MWSDVIQPQAPYSVDRLFGRLYIDPLQAIDMNTKEIKVPLILNGSKEVITLKANGDEQNPTITVTGEIDAYKATALKRISEMFDLNMNPKDIVNHFREEEILSLVERYVGMPIICEPDVYSALLKNIVHQQLNMKFAYTLTYRFVTTYGEEKNGVWFYPAPEVVSKLTVQELRELQFSNRKAEYVIGIANEISNGTLSLEELHKQTNQEVYDTLLPLRGVGPWTVECVLLFGLGRKNVLPAGDVGIQNAMKKFFDFPNKPSKEELYTYKEKWSPYSSYISMYLWESLNG